ncbi:MAG: putative metalloprotease CJM1_0395 family protein, partial [Desulfobacterales bacterium]
VQGGATYQYQRGPDGKMYAVGGEVKIDTTPERDPEDTIRKMQQVRKAALAPTQPSAQDRSVATQASQIEAEARAELTKKDSEDTKDKEEDPSASVSPKLAGIAETPHKISSISHHISITV